MPPAVAPSNCSDANVAAAFAQAMTSLENLANNCRDQGIDPMSMLTTMMSGSAARGSGAIGAPQIDADAVSTSTLSAPSDAELIEYSHDLINALDRADVATVAAALAPGFVRFIEGATMDRDALLLTMVQSPSKLPRSAQRSWDHESVVRKGDTLVFSGMAHEVQAGNDTHGGYLHDGWFLLQWVRSSDGWRVQLFTWQRELGQRDWWNDIFHKDRGFSHDPNRLLVETAKSEKPGAALDVAMGQGRNALYLASRGWRVTGVDGSEEGLRIASEQADAHNLALELVNANIDEWDFGVNRFDLVTLMYAGDHGEWIDKIKASLRKGGLCVVEGWAKTSPDNPSGFSAGQLANLFAGYEILRDEIVDDVPDWAWDQGKLVRFVARKK